MLQISKKRAQREELESNDSEIGVSYFLDKLVFEETKPVYVAFNVIVSLICIFSGYLYAYMAAFRGLNDEDLDTMEKLALGLEIIFAAHFIL